MVRELSALFEMLRKRREELKVSMAFMSPREPLKASSGSQGGSEKSVILGAGRSSEDLMSVGGVNQPWAHIVDFYDAFR